MEIISVPHILKRVPASSARRCRIELFRRAITKRICTRACKGRKEQSRCQDKALIGRFVRHRPRRGIHKDLRPTTEMDAFDWERWATRFIVELGRLSIRLVTIEPGKFEAQPIGSRSCKLYNGWGRFQGLV